MITKPDPGKQDNFSRKKIFSKVQMRSSLRDLVTVDGRKIDLNLEKY